ncbi:trafficking protein particle complex subunit 6A, putative [Hepatocystis sp. ex Piliocolobus tephrosceles]|nr:trafficking protein particle complex subunit 6A, putative [Hepatocystis sp. ex Piliocolobus tephrosceles]
MSENQISKTSLLLLIYEIINTNIKLLKLNEIEASSISSSDNDTIGMVNKKKVASQNVEHKEDEEKKHEDRVDKHKTDNLKNNNKNEIKKNKNRKSDHSNSDYNDDSSDNNNNHKDKSKKIKNESNYLLNNKEENYYMNILSSKLKNMGKGIGMKLIERILIYKTDITDIKDIIKLISKDIWFLIFNKNADRIQMYKKETFIITDNNIEFYLKYLLLDNQTNNKNSYIHCFLILIIGIIKGILKRFNINAYITYVLAYPQCTFQINIIDS